MTPTMTRLMAIGLIRTDGGTQPRAGLNEEVIEEYVEAWKAGGEFPPVQVCYDGQKYWLWDGFHRLEAAKRAERRDIEAKVYQGNVLHAQWLSFSANKGHGLRRSNEEKQNQVKNALQHEMGLDKSDREIATHCGVSKQTVANWRNELESQKKRPHDPGENLETAPKMTGQISQWGESDSEIERDSAQKVVRTGSDGRVYDVSKIRTANQARTKEEPSVIVLDNDQRVSVDVPRETPFASIRQTLLTALTQWQAWIADPMVPEQDKELPDKIEAIARLKEIIAVFMENV